MTPYRNLSGTSSVIFYDIAEDSIHVVFKSGAHRNYLYNQICPGIATVDTMKALAVKGHGLNSYISSTVKRNFAKKW